MHAVLTYKLETELTHEVIIISQFKFTTIYINHVIYIVQYYSKIICQTIKF